MPFVSKAQQGFMFAKHPGIAREMASKTRDFSALPQHKGMADKARKDSMMRMEASRRPKYA